MDDINTIGIVGLSQMGSGIVEVCARDLQALPRRPGNASPHTKST
jgi:3-hydroxyacyl-CoA dehydrogenase